MLVKDNLHNYIHLLRKKKMNGTYIETPRIILRNFCLEDAEGLFRILECPSAPCFIDEKLDTWADARKSVTWRSREPNGTQLAVCLKENLWMIGYLFGMFEAPDTFSVGWNFDIEFRGNGYATEAACAYLDYLFNHRGIRRVYAYVSPDNHRSRKLCKRLGMRFEGKMKEYISFRDDHMGAAIYEDTCIYAIIKKEWLTRNITDHQPV